MSLTGWNTLHTVSEQYTHNYYLLVTIIQVTELDQYVLHVVKHVTILVEC